MHEYNNTGFVNFPSEYARYIKRLNTGKSFIYLVAIDFNTPEFSKQKLNINGNYCGDDVTPRKITNTSQLTIDDLVNKVKNDTFTNDININNPLISSVLIGWSGFSYQLKDDIQPWICSFKELTNEGRKLYYSFKKLHNDKEVRLLTFNNIKPDYAGK